MPPRRRNWVFTLNNPTETGEELRERLSGVNHFRYLVFQKEQGENGTPHFQGYMEFTNGKPMSWLKNNISGTAHFEPRRGTREQARDYCMKEDTRVEGPWEAGVFTTQGERTDITKFKDAIKSGKRKRDLLDDFDRQIAKFPKFYDAVRSLYRPVREDDTYEGVVLLYGWPGTGKTRFVYDNYPDYWEQGIGSGSAWFDGYDGQKVVLFDDFSGKMSKVGLTTTLKLFDRYPRQVPVKGGFTWWMPNLVFVTSNHHPAEWYDFTTRKAQWPALKRRFTHIYWYKKDGTVQYIEDKEHFFEYSYQYDENDPIELPDIPVNNNVTYPQYG
jgi:hypothetical protein